MPYQAVHSPSALPHHQSWTQAHPRHRLAPSSSLPSSHGIFTTVAEFLPPLATAGQPLSPTMMMKLTSTAPTLPPHRGSRAPAARGNPAPHLPLLSCSVCRMRGFGAQTPIPRVLPLPSHLPAGSPSCPPAQLAQCIPDLCLSTGASSRIPFWPLTATPQPQCLWPGTLPSSS